MAFDQEMQYHIKDASCGINDPNGPFYDPLHKLHHLFYQLHIAAPDPVSGGSAMGPVWGHAVSADLVKWARLPVAIWNDETYDSKAIYTGSVTLVDGNPVIIYPGISDFSGTFNAARPANRSDPLLTRWGKAPSNPILNNTSDDPSTAWLTVWGEWRFVGNSVIISDKGNQLPLYGSSDNFTTVQMIGVFPHQTGGECASVFPLPAADAKEHADGLTHVLMQSGLVQLGRMVDAPPGQMSTWTPLGGNASAFTKLDRGANYAAKDSEAPPSHASSGADDSAAVATAVRRRLLWSWAVIEEGAMALPRELRYDEAGAQLTSAPVAELSKLRAQNLASIGPTPLSTGSHWLGDWETQRGHSPSLASSPSSPVGLQAEVIVTFARPSSRAIFGVDVFAGCPQCSPDVSASGAAPDDEEDDGGDPPAAANVSTRVYFDFDPATSIARVGITPGKANLSALMPGVALVGGDLETRRGDDAAGCRAACAARAGECFAWTTNSTDARAPSCSLKGLSGWDYKSDPSSANFTSGVLTPTPGLGGASDTLLVRESDATFEVRVFTDHRIVEAFWQDGRVAMTLGPQGRAMSVAGMNAFGWKVSDQEGAAPVQLQSATAWSLESIWATPEEVLARRRA